MRSYVGNFFARIFFRGLAVAALNFLFFGISIYLAGRLLNMQNNSLGKGFAVALAVLIVSFAPAVFFFVDQFFTLLIMFTVMVAAIKGVYKCDWLYAFLNLVIATVIATLANVAISPLLAGVIFS